MNRTPDHPDIVFFPNNGVLAVAPGPTGRLQHLVQRTRDDAPKVWLFLDIRMKVTANGDEYVDPLTRGIVCGSHKDGRTFLKSCAMHGLLVRSDRLLFVPCSNGAISATEHGRTVVGWEPKELALLRFDLPTKETLLSYRIDIPIEVR